MTVERLHSLQFAYLLSKSIHTGRVYTAAYEEQGQCPAMKASEQYVSQRRTPLPSMTDLTQIYTAD